MTYKKRFGSTNTDGIFSPLGGPKGMSADIGYKNYGSMLPDIYTGHPNRIERYTQYESMDMDPEINGALDILADFCTQTAEDTKTPFVIDFKDKPSKTESDIIIEQLKAWCNLNEMDKRISKMVRNTLKYGDQIFIRDPENFKLYWVDMGKVTKIVVNESQGKEPERYFIKDISPNFMNLTATTNTSQDVYIRGPQTGGPVGAYTLPNQPYTGGTRFSSEVNERPIDAKHIIHLSLTSGLDANWPFGISVLENIFKVYKQKELLEDAILIYRVQRAPERRVFKVDVGGMPPHLAMQYVERIKNELHQRRIPSLTGGKSNIMDAAYNPLCLDLSTEIPLLDGRTLTLSQLIDEFEQGKENWAYSCNPETGKVVPGVINWAGVTRKNAEVIKLTFDNGKTLICTPDHKIPVFGKGFVEAKDLTTDDSLISFNTQNKPIADENDYQQVWDHESKSWKWTHRIVGEFFKSIDKHQEFTYLEENIGKEKQTIHHIDCNRFNNDPRNLTFMNKEDHILWHASQKKSFWENMTEEYRTEITGKISATVKANWENLTPEAKQTALYKIRQAQKKAVLLRQTDPVVIETFDEEIENHRVVSIEKVEARDVGTITIDGTARWHDYHTFAISSGIFVKNSINEDYFFPVTAEGRGSSVDVLPGGQNLGEIDDLRYFNNKLMRGLRIPSSYLPTGPEDGTMNYTDGKVTTALIQENRFNQYCKGLQTLISSTLDREFKMFLSWRGYSIDNGLFDIKFSEPLNFAAYREIDLAASRINSFASLADVPYLSKRFILKKYLGLTEVEMRENEKLWKEENGDAGTVSAEGTDLRSVGITPGGITTDIGGIEDLEGLESMEAPPELGGPELGATPGTAPELGTPSAGPPGGIGATPPAPGPGLPPLA